MGMRCDSQVHSFNKFPVSKASKNITRWQREYTQGYTQSPIISFRKQSKSKYFHIHDSSDNTTLLIWWIGGVVGVLLKFPFTIPQPNLNPINIPYKYKH